MNTRTSRSMLVMAALAGSTVLSAQAPDPRAGQKLDAPSKAAFKSIVDSAEAQGLPSGPLYAKLSEGISKGANGPRIVAAIRTLAFDMATVQRTLGTMASSDEIKAAASAVHAGVPAVELGKLKKQGGLRRSLTLPFTVLADIVSRGVPVGAAANAIRSMIGAGAKDKEISDFQKSVKDDIEQGAPPAAAAETRARSATPATKPDKPDQVDRIDH